MDFVVGLPMTRKLDDSIWVIVDMMSKNSNFIPMKFTIEPKIMPSSILMR